MKVIYIAGPYLAGSAWGIELNIRKAEALWFKVNETGNAAICIHTMGRNMQNTLTLEHWLAADMEMLSRCDAMIATEGWESSEGTMKEVDFCFDHGIPFFKNFYDLRDWLRIEPKPYGSYANDPISLNAIRDGHR